MDFGSTSLALHILGSLDINFLGSALEFLFFHLVLSMLSDDPTLYKVLSHSETFLLVLVKVGSMSTVIVNELNQKRQPTRRGILVVAY